MEHTLKVTNVLSDPTRFQIYQFLIKNKQEITVSDIATEFDIHPNVARMHLTKLQDINLITSFPKKTGKGGRPSRIYKLSEEVIELNFPHRDYKMFSIIALETFAELGDVGKEALYNTGLKYGTQIMERYHTPAIKKMSIEQKLQVLEDAGIMLGIYPEFSYDTENNIIEFKVNNCPFKEIAVTNHILVCNMHQFFLKGMFESLFTNIKLTETENMFHGCDNCSYIAQLS